MLVWSPDAAVFGARHSGYEVEASSAGVAVAHCTLTRSHPINRSGAFLPSKDCFFIGALFPGFPSSLVPPPTAGAYIFPRTFFMNLPTFHTAFWLFYFFLKQAVVRNTMHSTLASSTHLICCFFCFLSSRQRSGSPKRNASILQIALVMSPVVCLFPTGKE